MHEVEDKMGLTGAEDNTHRDSRSVGPGQMIMVIESLTQQHHRSRRAPKMHSGSRHVVVAYFQAGE